MSSGRSLALRLLVSAVALASLAHVGALIPRFLAITRIVPPQAGAVVWGVLVTVATAVAACVLALLLAIRSWLVAGATIAGCLALGAVLLFGALVALGQHAPESRWCR